MIFQVSFRPHVVSFARQNACVTCAAKLAEISARLSLSNDRAEEEAVKELLCLGTMDETLLRIGEQL